MGSCRSPAARQGSGMAVTMGQGLHSAARDRVAMISGKIRIAVFGNTQMKVAFLMVLAWLLLGMRSSAGELAAPSDKAGESGKAIDTRLDDAHRPYDKDSVAHYNRAVDLHRNGFLEQAIVEYKAAIEADRRMSEAWSNLGLVYFAQGRNQESIETFEKSLALRPNSATSRNGYAMALDRAGQLDKALENWREAIKIRPGFKSAYHDMAAALERAGRHEEAEKVLEEGKKAPVDEKYDAAINDGNGVSSGKK